MALPTVAELYLIAPFATIVCTVVFFGWWLGMRARDKGNDDKKDK